jgi:DNA-3-methyladenine glycosylase
VAQDLLGCHLVSEVEGVVTEGRIVETEAYGGPEDPASHAAVRSGRTPRNDPMFGPPGTAYLYLSHGVHWCFNVVTGREGEAQAVLIRALEPLVGLEVMAGRRGGRKPLARGPGRLAQALGLDGSLNRHPLQRAPVLLLGGDAVDPAMVASSGRIGIRRARERPLRFYLRDHTCVSTGPHHPGASSPNPSIGGDSPSGS